MLKICSSALVLSNVSSFINYVSEIARDLGAEIESADEWNTNYRLNVDIIMCGTKYLPFINTVDYDKVRLILKTNETVSEFVKMGITHFIFDYTNVKEVAFSFYAEVEEKNVEEMSVTDIIAKTKVSHIVKGRYDFNFEANSFKYEGVGLYLRESEKKYLAKWLMLGIKDNNQRIILCKMRKRFGKDFMIDVDRLGKIKE